MTFFRKSPILFEIIYQNSETSYARSSGIKYINSWNSKRPKGKKDKKFIPNPRRQGEYWRVTSYLWGYRRLLGKDIPNIEQQHEHEAMIARWKEIKKRRKKESHPEWARGSLSVERPDYSVRAWKKYGVREIVD